MKLEELKFPKQKKKRQKKKQRNARVGIVKWCCCSTKKWKAGNYNGKEQNSVKKNAYYKELKPISNVHKEYIDEHESDN